jgi:hypothetical protein
MLDGSELIINWTKRKAFINNQEIDYQIGLYELGLIIKFEKDNYKEEDNL